MKGALYDVSPRRLCMHCCPRSLPTRLTRLEAFLDSAYYNELAYIFPCKNKERGLERVENATFPIKNIASPKPNHFSKTFVRTA